ncbi:hypothetical protein AUP42_06295 [Thalassospira lucentensis]|uniref:Uncharacterized protein n=1 Tax=Thalassospira lucentensis TaxID=168935 RepID=A0A154L155_9PROT|nr:hypothetical protein AUP42_06295 [Thalassospira lucentensis]
MELPIFQYVGNNPAKRKDILKNVFMVGLKMVCAISYILRKISRIPKKQRHTNRAANKRAALWEV